MLLFMQPLIFNFFKEAGDTRKANKVSKEPTYRGPGKDKEVRYCLVYNAKQYLLIHLYLLQYHL